MSIGFLGDRNKTFAGGVHPADKKELTAEEAIQPAPAGGELAIMLSQHIGSPCKALVEKKQQVHQGQKIGESDAFVSAAVHSPVTGRVSQIALRSHPVIGRSEAVVITPDADSPAKEPVNREFKPDFDPSGYSAPQIHQAVREAGIAGMGGAGFPTQVKLEPYSGVAKEVIIINGCECEPYITCDNRIMLEWAEQLIAGVKLVKKAADCRRVVIAIEDNKRPALKHIREKLLQSGNDGGIEVVSVRTKYPQGGERQLINSVLKKVVPTGQIPPMIGVLVLNVTTVCAIAEAVVLGNPLTHRVVTVTGSAVTRPGNYYVALGTSVEDLLKHCGPIRSDCAAVIVGGPMMGISIADLSTPITKTTGAITALTPEEVGKAKLSRQEGPCIGCGRCMEVCPENLNPSKIAHAIKYGKYELAQRYYISGCMECGSCSYICPANIELAGYIKTGKAELAREKKAAKSS